MQEAPHACGHYAEDNFIAETMAPNSALPIGAARVVSEVQPLLVDPALSGSGLYNAVLAILAPPNSDEAERYDEEILDLHVVGYIVMCVPILHRERRLCMWANTRLQYCA